MKSNSSLKNLHNFFLNLLEKLNCKLLFYSIIFLNLINILLELISVSLIIPIIIILTGTVSDTNNNFLNSIQKVIGNYSFNEQIIIISLFIIIISICKFFVEIYSKYLTINLTVISSQYLSKNALNLLIDTKLIHIDKLKIGEIRSRVLQFPGQISTILQNIIIFFSSLILIIFYFIFMCLISYKISLAVVIFFLIIMFFTSFFIKVVKSRAKNLDETSVFLAQYSSDIIKTLKIIKLYNAQKRVKKYLKNAYLANKEAILKLNLLQIINTPFLTLLGSTIVFILILSTIYVEATNQVNWLKTIIITLFILLRMISPISSLNASRILIASNLNALDLFIRFINNLKLNKVKNSNIKNFKFDKNIEFHKVSLSFNEKKINALKEISTKIEKNKFTSIIGMSGSGKTTFINLLANLYQPTDGVIKIDGVPLESIDFYEWTKKISFIPQEKVLYNYSIKENITFGNPRVSQRKLNEILKFCELSNFINKLSNGIDTTINENTNNLSGGEIQRIILARALIKNSEILILDEATNALDSINENYIFSLLKKLKKKKTIIVITHKTRYLPLSDKILVLNNGKIIEEGNYKMLTKKDGFVTKMKKLEKVINEKNL